MLLTPPLGEEQFPVPLPSVPVGGRLTQFLHHWEKFTTDVWVLSVIRGGLDLVFQERPPLSDSPIPMSQTSDKEKFRLLSEEVQSLLLKSVIEEIPPTRSTPGFYSRLFLVPKKTGGMRPVIDLSILNSYLSVPHFKMETNRSIRACILPGMLTTKLDLSDAYFHIPISLASRKFLPFVWNNKVYQFLAVPFGLAVAPQVFTRVFQTVIAHLHTLSIQAHSYLDDSLLKEFDSEILYRHTFLFIRLLLDLGFLISWKKSQILPSQDFLFLGEHYRTDLGLIFPPEEKFQSLCQKILIFSNSPSVMARQFSQLLGFLNSLAYVVPLGRLHIRPLQFFLQEHWDSASQVWEALVPILPVVLPHLDWWTRRENVLTGVALLHPVPSLTLYTDSSLQGWGAFLEGKSASGVWSLVQQQEHINLLEMRAVLLALQHFKTLLVSKAVVLATDNTTVVAYLQNQGGTRCHALFLLCKEILLLCLLSHIHLVVRHIPGTFNVLADCLSRFHNPVNTEWELRQVVFDSVVLRWDRPHVDLFATSLNHKLETFVSPVPDPLSFAVDAMSLSWDGMFAYAFPPFRFLLQVLLKIKQSDCKIILIAPAWPRQAWFPELLLLSCARPLKLPFRRDLLSQFKGKVVHPRPESLHLHAWLLSGRDSVRKAFLKEQPRTSLSLSTGIVYEAKWAIFCDWCSGRDIDPVRVTVQQLADFLVYLFEIKRLVPSTIKGYRSAIGRTISLLGGPDFGQNEYISLLVRSFSLERPKQNKLVPQWNLGLVLAALNSPPFEPAEKVDLRFLYYKCCFLLALASGRRRSEIHAFSVSDSCLRFNRNKSSVTLLTDPCFLGKNQIPDRGTEPVIIPALPEDASSRLSCPIRILSIYLDRTKNSRPANNTRLFLPLKKGISDISAKTISSWICRTILLAYESSGEKFLNRHAVKAHEVRALASSWALFNSASISEVLSAGFWRCQDSFTSFYLRSMSAQADSLFSLGPIVAAQHVSVPLVSERSGDSAVC